MKYLALALFVAAGVFLSTPVSAEEGKVCTMQYQPVCGAKPVQCIKAPCYPQYHTYGNSCMLAADDATFIHEGECTATETGPVKPEEPKPYTPPAGCIAWNDGCNTCTLHDGQAACTLMFCSEPGAGYCTAYASSPKPDTKPPVAGAGNPALTASSSATTTLEASPEPGFFAKLWLRVSGWFDWFR